MTPLGSSDLRASEVSGRPLGRPARARSARASRAPRRRVGDRRTAPARHPAVANALAGFLCPLSANSYGVEFLSFDIKDYESKTRIFRVGRDMEGPMDGMEMDVDPHNPDSMRTIRYKFSEDVLRMPVISTA